MLFVRPHPILGLTASYGLGVDCHTVIPVWDPGMTGPGWLHWTFLKRWDCWARHCLSIWRGILWR